MKTTANTTITGFQSKKLPVNYVMLVSRGRMMNHPVMIKYFRKEFKLLSLNFPYALQGFGNSAPS
jgi:hypothetical protein